MSKETELRPVADLPSEVRLIPSGGDGYVIQVEDEVSGNRLAVTGDELRKIGDLIASTRADTSGEWVRIWSVDDLPKENKSYLFQRRSGGVEINFYVPNHSPDNAYVAAYGAWCEVPTPPDEQEANVR